MYIYIYIFSTVLRFKRDLPLPLCVKRLASRFEATYYSLSLSLPLAHMYECIRAGAPTATQFVSSVSTCNRELLESLFDAME